MAEPMFIAGPWRVDDDSRPGMAYNRHVVLDRDPDMRICFMAHDGEAGDAQFKATASLIAAAPDLYEAAQLLEAAEDAHANCPECDGTGVPELCERCFPLFDDARLKRLAALAKAEGT